MGWFIALGVIFLLAILPLGIGCSYDCDGVVVRILAGPLGFKVYPVKKTKEKPKEDKKNKEKKPANKPTEKTPAPKGGSLKNFMPLVRVALDFLGDFRRKLRVRRLELNLVLGGGDPCDLAVNYGKAWAALGNLWPKLEQIFVIQKRDVEIQCDFEASQTLVTACVEITITLGRLLCLAAVYGVRAIKEFMKLQKLQKGGTVK